MQLRARLLAVAIAALAIAAITVPTRAQAPDPARLAAAKDMMEASRVDKQFEQVIPLLLDRLKESFRTMAPDKRDVIDGVFEQMQSKFISRRAELLDEIAVALCAKAGGRGDEGRGRVLPVSRSAPSSSTRSRRSCRNSMLAGQRWGQRIGREIEEEARRELKRRGVDL